MEKPNCKKQMSCDDFETEAQMHLPLYKKTAAAPLTNDANYIAPESNAAIQHEPTIGNKNLPKIVSLFCGAGGLDLGFKDEGFDVSVAIDISSAAIKTHKKNFPDSYSVAADLVQLGPCGVLRHVSENIPYGSSIGVIGGPPCQGFSRANCASKSDDPRNLLPKLYIEVVKKLQQHYIVEFIVLENVLGIRDKKHFETYQKLCRDIQDANFEITEKELCALDFGVPQVRRRVVLSALRAGQGYSKVVPKKQKGQLTVADAIKDIEEPAFFKKKMDSSKNPLHPNHWTMQPKSSRFSDPNALNISAKKRSFKRLSWELPSLTVAYGHREIHVHPDGKRRLSIYEAMLLQGFPQNFVIEGNFSEQVEQVSNAVPPPVAKSIAAAVKLSMQKKTNNMAAVEGELHNSIISIMAANSH